MRKVISIVALLLFFSLSLFSQNSGLLRDFHKNWKVSAMGGASYLAFELKKDFMRATMDMNSTPNLAFSVTMNKRFNHHFEVGLEYEKSYFSGFKNNSSNVNWLMYDPQFNNGDKKFIPNALYYDTDISSFYLNFYYCFLNMYSMRYSLLNMNFFLKGGLGFSSIGVAMGYKNPEDYIASNLLDPIYVKGQGRHPWRDSYGTLHLGLGINYYLSSRWSMVLDGTLLFVSSDYLDGVHNFDIKKLPDEQVEMIRIGVFDFVGQLKVGVTYHFDLYKGRRWTGVSPFGKKRNVYKNDFFIDKKYNRVRKPHDTFYKPSYRRR
ncbi:MAG TPA: hypothetical protein PKV50_03460 [Prolixibacteraceae bacterium]|nr:hypothetical protein [Bacteroidales bacterium]HUM88562.1 hypothetical protein [Prolixibacteraceae bacterium]